LPPLKIICKMSTLPPSPRDGPLIIQILCGTYVTLQFPALVFLPLCAYGIYAPRYPKYHRCTYTMFFFYYTRRIICTTTVSGIVAANLPATMACIYYRVLVTTVYNVARRWRRRRLIVRRRRAASRAGL